MKTRFLLLVALPLAGIVAVSCHVKQEGGPAGPDSQTSQVIKFENTSTNMPVVVRIPDANQEFGLEGGESKTVEAYSAEGSTIFYVEVFRGRLGDDLTTVQRWTGYAAVDKVVTIFYRLGLHVEVHD